MRSGSFGFGEYNSTESAKARYSCSKEVVGTLMLLIVLSDKPRE